MSQRTDRSVRPNADRHFIGTLERVIRRGKRVLLTAPEGESVWVDPAAGIFMADLSRARDFFGLPPDALDVRACPVAPPGSEFARPLPELMWLAAYYAADDELPPGCGLHDVIELVEWPNLTQLPHTREMIMLASLLFKRPHSLSFAYRMLKIPQSDAVSFYRAGRAAGLIRTVSSLSVRTLEPDDQAPANTESTGKGLWHRLFHRLTRL